MKKIGIILVSVFLVIVCLGTSNATVLDFDDLYLEGYLVPVPANYGGLTWNDSWWASEPASADYQAHSGMAYVSSYGPPEGLEEWAGLNYVVFPTGGYFQGAYFSGPAGYTVGYDLYYQGVIMWSTNDVGLQPTPAFVASNYAGLVDKVVIRASQGFFAMDDFEFTAVPVPPAFLLVLSGLGGCAVLRSRFKR